MFEMATILWPTDFSDTSLELIAANPGLNPGYSFHFCCFRGRLGINRCSRIRKCAAIRPVASFRQIIALRKREAQLLSFFGITAVTLIFF